MLLAALPWSFLIVFSFVVMQKTTTTDHVGRFMLTSVFLSSLQQIIPLYFILTLPKLKAFAIESYQSFFTKTFVGKELAFWSYVFVLVDISQLNLEELQEIIKYYQSNL